MDDVNSEKIEKDSVREETLLEFLRRSPIDEETWKVILDRPTDPPREFSFDDFDFEDETLKK